MPLAVCAETVDVDPCTVMFSFPVCPRIGCLLINLHGASELVVDGVMAFDEWGILAWCPLLSHARAVRRPL